MFPPYTSDQEDQTRGAENTVGIGGGLHLVNKKTLPWHRGPRRQLSSLLKRPKSVLFRCIPAELK